MSGINRFLSRREKRSSGVPNDKPNDKPHNASHSNLNLFSLHDKKKADKEETKKVQAIMQQLTSLGITTLKEPQVEYALRSKASHGDSKKALELLIILEDSVEGVIRRFNPNVKLLGAENRQGNTCYLDATLFAMYAGLDSFEAMLYDNFADEPRRDLALLLRLWVNMLRAGKLITTDLTERLQETIATCGWEDAAKVRQQDASEAFTFITGKLELPLLTLKMDIYHTGKEEASEDHKFVNERLLDVAIPSPPEDGSPIRLEDCLETYFNNRIEVKRHLHRRSTIQSVRSLDSGKGLAVHVETVEVGSRPESPTSLTTITTSQLRPASLHHRTPSLFSERKLEVEYSSESRSEDGKSDAVRHRTGSITRKEVLMPAWQFFSLLPWYTNNAPTSDDQVAAHFASTRPVLGICLKRYGFTTDGKAIRLDTYIDIPLEIALPDFISDDEVEGRSPAFGSFKLSLQSVVCHRGTSLNSGHYVTLSRLRAPDNELSMEARSRPGTSSSEVQADRWVRFDDLASERVSPVDVAQALKSESPYLLFYQVRPIDEEPHDEPPPYFERTSTSGRSEHESGRVSMETDTARPSTDVNGWTRVDNVPDVAPDYEDNRTAVSFSEPRRSSVAFTDTSETSLSGSLRSDQLLTEPTTPLEESRNGFLTPSRRGSKSGKRGEKGEKGGMLSNTGSQLSVTISRLSKLGVSRETSKEKSGAADVNGEPPAKSSARHSFDLLRSGRYENGATKEKNMSRSTSLMGRRLGKSSRKMKPPERECILM